MQLSDLYQDIKGVLNFFNLGFHEMDKVTVTLGEDSIIFTYGGKVISVVI